MSAEEEGGSDFETDVLQPRQNKAARGGRGNLNRGSSHGSKNAANRKRKVNACHILNDTSGDMSMNKITGSHGEDDHK